MGLIELVIVLLVGGALGSMATLLAMKNKADASRSPQPYGYPQQQGYPPQQPPQPGYPAQQAPPPQPPMQHPGQQPPQYPPR